MKNLQVRYKCGPPQTISFYAMSSADVQGICSVAAFCSNGHEHIDSVRKEKTLNAGSPRLERDHTSHNCQHSCTRQ